MGGPSTGAEGSIAASRVIATDPKIAIEPANKIPSIARRIALEFQCMVAFWVFDDLPPLGRQPLKVGQSLCIVDDAILASEQQQGGLMDFRRRSLDQAVNEEAGGHQPGCSLT
jgi:hypothetical protein